MSAERILGLFAAKADALVRRDASSLAALIHPSFLYANVGGQVFDKAGYIDAYCTSGRVVFLSQKTSDLRAAEFEGFTVANMTLDDRYLADGQTVEARYRSLCVFSITATGDLRWAAGQTMAWPEAR